MKAPTLIHLSRAIKAWCAEPEFNNSGTLDGFTGGNQRTKLSVSTAQDADGNGTAEISINGQPVTWFRDQARKQPVGHRITGAFLPDLPKSEWQLQLGGYGFFKDRDTGQAIVFIDDVRVSRSFPEPIPSTKP